MEWKPERNLMETIVHHASQWLPERTDGNPMETTFHRDSHGLPAENPVETSRKMETLWKVETT